MRLVVAIVLGLAVLWAGYWFVGSTAVVRGAEAAVVEARAQGLVAERDDMALRGFPNRFDLTVTGLSLADPVSGTGWQAPFVQVLTLSYKPWHVILALPNEQTVTLPAGQVRIASSKMQASVRVRPSGALPLDRVAGIAEGLRMSGPDGFGLGAERVRFATRALRDTQNTHELGLSVTGLAPDPGLVAASGMPPLIERLEIAATAAFTAPLDRHAGTTKPSLTVLDLTEASLRWGDVALFAKGRVVADAQGRAEGRIEVRVEQWRSLLPLAEALGLLPSDMRPTMEAGLGLLAQQSGEPEVLALPLVFDQGRMSFGPIQLGPAPMLR